MSTFVRVLRESTHPLNSPLPGLKQAVRGACATLLEESASVAASLAIKSAGRGSLGGRGDRTAGAAARLAQSARLLEGALGIRRSSEPFPGADERPRGAVGSKVKKAEEGRGGERRRRRPP
eukprot:1175842-Prorocentrum_minimum.AAC.1